MRLSAPLCHVAVLALFFAVAVAQPSSLKVAFTSGSLPSGYSRYSKSGLNQGSRFVVTSLKNVAPPYRAFVKNANTITYKVSLKPGTYVVRLGFAELNRFGCRTNVRTFTATVNNKKTPLIDIYTLAKNKCQTPYIYTMQGVVVKSNGVFQLSVNKVSKGWPPIISTLEAELTSPGSSGGGSSNPPAPAPPSSNNVALFIDVGGSSDQPKVIRGKTTVYGSRNAKVAGTTQDATYARHRFGKDFTYLVNVKPNSEYTVAILTAEMYKPACKKGFRLFDVFAHDGKKKFTFGERIFNVDVFARGGCQTAYRLVLPPIKVGPSGEIAIRFRARKNNAMVSAIEILPGKGGGSAPAPTAVPTTAPTAAPTAAPTSAPPSSGSTVYNIDIGSSSDIASAVKGSSKVFKPVFTIKNAAKSSIYSQHRFGSDFTYSLPVTKGATYSVDILLAEAYQPGCKVGFRIFDITVYDSGKSQGSGEKLSDLDVFALAGCRTAYTATISGVKVTSGNLAIRFKAKKNNAMVGAIIVKTGDPVIVLPPASPSPSPDSEGPMLPPKETTPTPEPASGKEVTKVDSAGSTDTPKSVSGVSKTFNSKASIAMTTEDSLFAGHRFGKSFTYEVPVKSGITYSVNLFFAESYKPGCVDGFRIFDVSVFDVDSGEAKGSKVAGVDVFKSAGCQTAYTLPFNDIKVGTSGKISIKLTAKKNNAMISGFEVLTTDPDYIEPQTPPPTTTAPQVVPTSASSPTPTTDQVAINVGAGKDKNVAGTRKVFTNKFVSGTKNAGSGVYKTARVGENFQYTFNLDPGAYDIILGFAELDDGENCVEPGKRVFNVLINDEVQLEGFDIYGTAGCLKGVEEKFTQSVSAILTKPLVIRFESVIGEALLSYISIKPAAAKCIPESTTGELAADHAAHSVPGSYPPQLNANSPKSYVDSDGDGFVTVKIDGSGSHTHFFDSKNNIVGRLTKFTWTLVETGEVISNKVSFFYKFPLGATRLRLSVIDNSCTTDEAETTVTVTGAVQPGQFCYYYAGLTEAPIGGTLLDDPRPQYAVASKSVDLNFPKFPFLNTGFAARCFFFLEVDKDSESTIKINTFGTGNARVYKGEDLIIDSEASDSTETELPIGLTGFEVTFLRTKLNAPPRLQFVVDGKVPPLSKISHDRKTVLPILSGVAPNEGPIKGGTQVKVTGFAMFQPLKVTVDGKAVKVLPFGVTPNQFFIKTPSVTKAGVAEIVVTTASDLPSNPVNFAYGSTCDSVGFEFKKMKTPSGGDVNNLQLPTCAMIGHDNRLYLGTLGGTVQVVTYDRITLETVSRCYSTLVTDNAYKIKGKPSIRDILGITADPRDKVIRPYISTSTLFADRGDKSRIDPSNEAAWRNGAIERLKPGKDKKDPNVCLVYDKRIVTGIPVSNHDHAVNALLFSQDGDLLIAVGGNTNMGLPSYKLGNLWEGQLSAAILVAKLSKKGFNGNIQYSNDKVVYQAKKTAGDVDIYASGLRNCFAMTMNSVGEVFATDQSSNCGFGNVATECGDFNLAAAQTYNYAAETTWPGKLKIKGSFCGSSVGRPDKVVQVEKNKFYGHPNILRGECQWIDPFTHKTVDGKGPPSNYKKPIVTLKSPATGLGQYRGNHFCGKLRGELITSEYKGGNTFRLRVANGKKAGGPDRLLSNGGIAFAENAHGELLFPRLNIKQLFMMQPKVNPQAGLFISGLSPFRHGKNGGTPLTIGGFNFGVLPSVKIGGKTCTVTLSSETEITCTVPAYVGGPKSLTVTSATGDKQTLKNAVLYMNV